MLNCKIYIYIYIFIYFFKILLTKIYIYKIYRATNDLSNLLRKRCVDEDDIKRICKQLLLGFNYLHNLGIVHRDLKPENILYNEFKQGFSIKITDFGLSSFVEESQYLQTFCGTPLFFAPEVIANNFFSNGYGKSCDLWSIGVTLYLSYVIYKYI